MTHTVESLMALAEAHASADCAEHHALENGTGREFEDAVEATQSTRAALRAALTEALEQPADCNALMLVKDCLMQANEQVNGPIVDTIWFSQTETLFDYIDSALQAAQPVAHPDYTLLRQALEALLPHKSNALRWYTPVDAAIDALRARLESV